MGDQEAKGGEAVGTAKDGRIHPFEPPFGDVGRGLEELVAEGKVGEPVPQGIYMALLGLVVELKARRESMGLSLTDASERSGMTRQVISKLENGQTTNPTLASLWKYASALGAEVSFAVRDAEGWDDPDGSRDPAGGEGP